MRTLLCALAISALLGSAGLCAAPLQTWIIDEADVLGGPDSEQTRQVLKIQLDLESQRSVRLLIAIMYETSVTHLMRSNKEAGTAADAVLRSSDWTAQRDLGKCILVLIIADRKSDQLGIATTGDIPAVEIQRVTEVFGTSLAQANEDDPKIVDAMSELLTDWDSKGTGASNSRSSGLDGAVLVILVGVVTIGLFAVLSIARYARRRRVATEEAVSLPKTPRDTF